MPYKTLRDLHQHFESNSQCSLKHSATQAVLGRGNEHAEIMFIGEAPGKKEDETGTPFVGASGKFLDEMLARANMKRDDLYITNIVKYRPPENRDPSPEEIKACEDWLHAEIHFIQPKVIVTLGRYALNHFIPNVKISEAHGQVFYEELPNLGTQTFFALYHPAAALYNGGMREILVQDFLKLLTVLKEQGK